MKKYEKYEKTIKKLCLKNEESMKKTNMEKFDELEIWSVSNIS